MKPSMRRFFVFSSVFLFFLTFIVLPVFAEEKKQAISLPQPIILPTSPFYFLKEWRRNIMRSFTRDPLSQIVLELDILDEKAGELKKIHEIKADDYSAIKNSLEKYKTTQDILREKLENISSINKEKDRNALAENLFNRLAVHNSIFNNIFSSYPENKQVSDVIGDAKQKIANSATKTSEAVSEKKFKELIKSSFISPDEKNTSEEIDMMERMKETASEKTKNSLEDIELELLFGTSTTSTISFSTTTSTTSTTSTILHACVMIYEPVCGNDEKTYANVCLAQNAGVQIKQKGECEKNKE